jgi:hypothetical protein
VETIPGCEPLGSSLFYITPCGQEAGGLDRYYIRQGTESNKKQTVKTPKLQQKPSGGSDRRLVRPVEIKHGMQVTDLRDSQNLTSQKRKSAKDAGIATIADAWPQSVTVYTAKS